MFHNLAIGMLTIVPDPSGFGKFTNGVTLSPGEKKILEQMQRYSFLRAGTEVSYCREPVTTG